MARNLRTGPKWVPGVILERTGPLSYVIETTDKQIWRRHVDQLKALGDGVCEEDTRDDSEMYPTSAVDPTQATTAEENPEPELSKAVQTEVDSSGTSQPSVGESLVPVSRYPTHTRKPPDRLVWT